MKKAMILLALILSAGCIFAQGFMFNTPEGSVSMSITGLEPEGDATVSYLIAEIEARLDILQRDYLKKLKKNDARKANSLVDEIYELLAWLPEDAELDGVAGSANTNTNTNTSSNTNTSNISINIIDSQSQSTQTTPPPVYVNPYPVIQPAPDPRMVIGDSEFSDLVSRIGRESFSDNKLRVLRTAAKNYRFTCGQIVRLIGAYTYSEDKLEALRISYPGCPDPQNNFKILDAFTYSTDKADAEMIINSF